ncbi:unnamed protein product [Thelazia callipaeda]|uniref:BIG2 domain-containing protein n=1 Tax=Thelazia callipaeda TaxID=103827 RepID=A0A0N5CML2_THECL|nr:unnamed protein product [Thelazia callipaeda]
MSVLNVLLFGYFTVLASTYRLNVPRVLLPYHPNVQVTFDLTVSDPEDGCFSWRTTRPDVVSIKVLNPIKTSDCSSRARIAATSKYSDEQTAVIFAENKDAGIVLTCGVTVDVIRSIIISTTTKVLFLDASPAKVVIQAYNAEGDMFTNLGEIPFEWHLESSSEKPLRIVPFSQSKYKAPDGVRFLEDNKKRGYVILVEGISTGAASLEAKLIESHFKNVEAQRVDLIVVANLLLVPSQDIYVPLGSYVHYSAEIIKQGITEEITLPAKQYHLVINNSEICSLDTQTSMVVALKYGTTEISIIDENVKSSNTLKPPSARIHVVEPMSLSIKISGDSWYLEKGREYQIFFVIVDDSNHILHVPEDSERKILPSIKDEVTTTISEPVQVSPPVVVFPYTDDKKMNSAKLSARGGTGSFIWSSENPEIAFIDSSGILSSRKLGKTKVVARDLQNVNHFGQAIVQIVEPAGIAFGTSHIEAEIGNDLVLFVSLYASMGDEKIVISDCRQLNFLFEVQDSNIFKISSQHSPYVSLQGDGCSSFVLTALNSGDTTVTVRLGAMSASILISAYPPLRLETPTELLLLHGSSFYVRTSGGPRPWVLDPSKYYTKLTYSNASALITENASQNDRKIITCRENEGDVVSCIFLPLTRFGVLKVTIVTGNEASYTNPLPAVAEAKFRVCCGVPSRLLLSLQRSLGNKCPTKVHAVSFSQPSTIVVEAFGHCKSGPSVGLEQQILSLTSLRLNWSLSDSNIAHVDESERGLYSSEIYGILKPQNIVGHVQIFATAYEYLLDGLKHCLPKMLQSKMQITLVENAEALPSTVILLNEKKATKDIRLVGGSGYFSLRPYDTAMLDVKMQTDIAQVRPLTVGKSVLHFTDLCTEKNFTATISISEVEEILIEAPHFVALHSEQNLHLKIRDVEGSFFVTDDANVMDVQVNSSKTAVTLTRIDSLHYTLRGEMTGVVTLRASARRANGQILQSHSHRIQVYAPLQLQPKVITLIPNSVFQLEISGGPQPLPPLHFHLNNTSAADISPNGFITSKIIGYTEIIGSVDLENNAPIQDKVIVRTVLLSGVRIRLSTLRIQVGEKAWARLDGLTEDQTPFSFGGALYPLHIYWTIATPGIIEAVSPFGALVSESSENRFQIEVKALAAGQAVIRLSVNISTFLGGFPELIQHYDDEIILTVIEPIQLIKPVLHPEVLRISPDAELTLKSNR